MSTLTPTFREVNGWAYPLADDFMWREAKPDGSYQKSHLDAALKHVTDWRCAIDGGAHVGQFTKPLASRFKHVIAVEPAADTFACLVENTQRFALTNVELRQVALGSTVGRVSMALDAKQTARGNTGGRYIVLGGDIPIERIDDWRLDSLGLLTLDVEGSEMHALNGAVQTLTRCKPIVLFENKGFCARFGFHRDAPQNLLTTLGYRLLVGIGDDQIWGSS